MEIVSPLPALNTSSAMKFLTTSTGSETHIRVTVERREISMKNSRHSERKWPEGSPDKLKSFSRTILSAYKHYTSFNMAQLLSGNTAVVKVYYSPDF